MGPKLRWDLYHLTHFLLESIGFPLIQDKVWSSGFLLSPCFSKYSSKVVPELKSSAMRLLSNSHKMHYFFFLIVSYHTISRQCKHQCLLMNCNGSSLVPGNNFSFSSILQRLILAWSLHLIIIFKLSQFYGHCMTKLYLFFFFPLQAQFP